MHTRHSLLAFVATLLACGLVSAGDTGSQEAVIKSDRADQVDEHTIQLTGNVLIAWDGLEVRANSAQMRKVVTSGQPSVTFTAVGDVLLRRGSDQFRFGRLEFNPETGLGSFELPTPTD